MTSPEQHSSKKTFSISISKSRQDIFTGSNRSNDAMATP